MNGQLLVALVCIVAYGLALGASTALVSVLRRPWRQSVEVHWAERARLAFAPGFALLWLVMLLPPLLALLGSSALPFLNSAPEATPLGFVPVWAAALAGVLTARYRWIRELWSPRVTLLRWFGGCLVLVLALAPHVLVALLLFFLLPENPGWSAVAGFSCGLLATAFFATGGGLLLLSFLRVTRPAPPPVIRIVEQLAQQMKVPGPVRVLELNWAQVNAVAWALYRTVGFSRPLLALLDEDEIRAVAAHELAHLTEPRTVRAVRIAHTFAYLLVAPVVKYAGTLGLLVGWLLILALAMSHRRFNRRLEVRADKLESEAIADPNAYARSLIKLHQANVTPAVLPGAQTHPHLYDRLLAGGAPPDFPRPAPPSRAKPLLAVAAAILPTTLALFLFLVTCIVLQHRTIPSYQDPTAQLPSRFKTSQQVPLPDFTEAAKDPNFQQAIRSATSLLGAEPQPLTCQAEGSTVNGGVSFDVPHDRLEQILVNAHTNFLARGFYLFRCAQHYGVQGQADKVGLLPTRDKYAVMAAMATNGDNYQIGTAGVIAWMRELEGEQPFLLPEIGFDYLQGFFTSPVKDASALAQRMYQFCPDIVSQGTQSISALAQELRQGRLFFWWD